MFFEIQTIEERTKYELLLRIVAALSKLSAESSSTPYLYYRMAENIFCKAFTAKNLSRSDISIDATKNSCGIGLKTFLHKNSHCLEKIAEFNKERNLYIDYISNPKKLIKKIAEFRNNRILSTCGMCSIPKENLIYHCVTRANSVLYLHEEPMSLIDIGNIKIEKYKKGNNTIFFQDGIEEYCFNISKSTLFKRFDITPIYSIPVKIFDDPFDLLERYLSSEFQADNSNKIIDTIYLPLYSYKKGRVKYIPTKSGLNQWNAGGRKRKPNEVYIRVPAEIRKHKPDFFPSRDVSFTLNLPNGSFKMAKICQDNDKALMSNPNDDLGKWILRDVLNVQENELVTYEKLEQIGIDTIQLNKYEDGTYDIDFKAIGTFEAYKQSENIT